MTTCSIQQRTGSELRASFTWFEPRWQKVLPARRGLKLEEILPRYVNVHGTGCSVKRFLAVPLLRRVLRPSSRTSSSKVFQLAVEWKNQPERLVSSAVSASIC